MALPGVRIRVRYLSLMSEKFAYSAHPYCWMSVADDLYTQAAFLRKRQHVGELIRTGTGLPIARWRADDRAVFLLAAFSAENAIKAFLVYENPNWISNGKLAKPLRSHRLVSLRDQSKEIPFKRRYTWVLNSLGDGIDSWARYPCGLSAGQSEDLQTVTEEFWEAYNILMLAYARKMKSLLRRRWNGPHGIVCSFSFKGETFFGI